MSLSFSLKRLISGQNIEEERHKHDPSRAKQRHIFRRPLKKLSVFNKYFEFHKVFSLETNTTGKQCSMARNASNVFMGLTRETHPCQQNSPPEPFKLPENSSPTIASEDCDILPSVELNTHTNAQNFDSNVAWHGSMHDHDSPEGHANLRPFLDPEDITRSLHSEQTAGQTKTQAPSAIDLRRETSRTTVHGEELDPYHNLPMNDHPHSKRLRDELEQRQDREECNRAVRALQEKCFDVSGMGKWVPAIVGRANLQAESFISSPAKYLFDVNPRRMAKLHDLYQQAVNLSYHLRTRRPALKISTLKDLSSLYDINDPKMTLHTMVIEDDGDKLNGHPLTLVIHPAIQSYGTERGVKFESETLIWASAEVWFYNPLPKGPESNVGGDAGVKP